jgi:hypothetical protein
VSKRVAMEVETYGRSREETGSRAPNELDTDLLMLEYVVEGSTKPNLICMVPIALVDVARIRGSRRTAVITTIG